LSIICTTSSDRVGSYNRGVETELGRIFESLSELLAEYSPPLSARTGRTPDKPSYELWSETPVEIEGRRREELFFAGLIVQKGYVGFYFMPVYTDPEKAKLFHPDLLKLLRGKSCFHVKRLDDELARRIESALREGFALWRRRGWIATPA